MAALAGPAPQAGSAPAGGRGPGGASGLAGALRGRNGAILAAGGTVGLVALVTLLRGKKAAPTDTTGSTGTSQQAYDSTLNDLYDQWQQQFEQLQGEVNNLGALPGTSGPPRATLPARIDRPFPTLPSPPPYRRVPRPFAPVASAGTAVRVTPVASAGTAVRVAPTSAAIRPPAGLRSFTRGSA